MRAPLRRASLGVALALLSALPSSARGDLLRGTKASLLGERANDVELRLDRGHATLVVRRTFDNRSALFEQAILDITSLPTGAVATGLRTLGGTTKEPIWYAAELLDAEVAAERYRALTGVGAYFPKDPALLWWLDRRHLALQVFPIAPKGEKTVEYTLTVPTSYVDGRHELWLPQMQAELPATITLRPARGGDALFVDGLPVAAGDVRRLLGDLRVSVRPTDAPKLGGRFSTYTFAKQRALMHAAIEVADPVSVRPAGAYVVVLLDGSRSLDDERREAQRAAARAYLHDLPDAKAQIVVFDRVARPLEAGFVSSAQARADLAAATITPRNGSELDVALADAAARLATAPSGAPRRILALTDLATRSTLVPARVTGLAAGGAIVHLATVAHGTPSVQRDDADVWASVPRATGGLLWRASASSADESTCDDVFEEWARPRRIDRLSVAGVGLDASALELPDALDEGQGWERLLIRPYGTPALEVRGELWSTPISTVLASNADEERRWAALAMTSDLLDELKAPEVATLAFKGGAVSPMTSYLAIEPGVRPSTEGLEGHVIGGRLGAAGIGDGIGLGSIGSLRATTGVDPAAWLRDALAPLAKACGGGVASVRLETTWHEIVAVDVVPAASNDKYAACLREGAFGLELPEVFRASWAKWEVVVPK